MWSGLEWREWCVVPVGLASFCHCPPGLTPWANEWRPLRGWRGLKPSFENDGSFVALKRCATDIFVASPASLQNLIH